MIITCQQPKRNINLSRRHTQPAENNYRKWFFYYNPAGSIIPSTLSNISKILQGDHLVLRRLVISVDETRFHHIVNEIQNEKNNDPKEHGPIKNSKNIKKYCEGKGQEIHSRDVQWKLFICITILLFVYSFAQSNASHC